MCSACQKSFARRSHQIIHERLHSGERSYVYSVCQKSFNKKDTWLIMKNFTLASSPIVYVESFAERSHLIVMKHCILVKNPLCNIS